LEKLHSHIWEHCCNRYWATRLSWDKFIIFIVLNAISKQDMSELVPSSFRVHATWGPNLQFPSVQSFSKKHRGVRTSQRR
jgi:hypothetical protein